MASTPPDNSSTSRKVTIPAAAFALTVLAVIGLQVAHAPLDATQYGLGSAAVTTLLTFLGDYFLPDRFLA